MIRIGLRITLQSPALLAAAPPASNLTETLDYIPGNTVRGLLARRYLDVKGNADAAFTELFATGQTRFGCGQILGAEVIPLSARSCKYYGGFRRDGSHGVLDCCSRRARSAARITRVVVRSTTSMDFGIASNPVLSLWRHGLSRVRPSILYAARPEPGCCTANG